MFNDKILNCRDCGRDLEFSASEKGFTNEPKRSLSAMAAKKSQTRNQGGGGYGRQECQKFPAVCATCGKDTMVPFQPSGEKPVYCRECFVPPTRSNW